MGAVSRSSTILSGQTSYTHTFTEMDCATNGILNIFSKRIEMLEKILTKIMMD